MQQPKKNLNRFDLIFYVVLFLGILIPLLFTGWQMGLFRKPIEVDAAPLVRSNSRPLRVAVATDFAPHSFLNKEGQLSGMDVEILYDLANRMQRKPELITGTGRPAGKCSQMVRSMCSPAWKSTRICRASSRPSRPVPTACRSLAKSRSAM